MVHYLFLLLLPLLSLAQDVQLLNTGPEVKALLTAGRGKTFPEQLELWHAFEAKYQDIYDEAVFAKRTDPRREEKRLARIRNFFGQSPETELEMLRLFDQAEEITATQLARFRASFPDLPAGIPVVFLPGLTFNGKVDRLTRFGRPALLIAADIVAARRDPVDILFSHEFFHVYHFPYLPDSAPHAQSMASPLWMEGFATYVSEVFNPGASPAAILMDDELAQGCADKARVAEWAREFLEIYAQEEMTDAAADAAYANWFMGSGPALPHRRGYCLGYLAVKSAAESIPVAQLAQWDSGRFFPLVGEKLTALSQP